MDQSQPPTRRWEEPIDERGHMHEAQPSSRGRPPPPRLDSVIFPTDRLPQLEVPIIRKLPDVGRSPPSPHPDMNDNHNQDPSLPLPVTPEKTMFNLWEKTQTQTEVKWTRPDNAGQFDSIAYQIQIKVGEEAWQELNENRVPVYRVYFTEGTAIFGRTKVIQENSTTVVHLRIRPIGILNRQGREERKVGPWSEDILFSLEGVNTRN